MPSILDVVPDECVRRFNAGEVVLEQGTRTGRLFFLVEGSVELVKDDMQIATASQPGAVFGEMAALLGGDHTVTVRALKPCTFRVVENAREFLEASPQVCLYVCEMVARRLDTLNKYLVDVRRQFEGTGHIGMLDEILETLMHRQVPKRIRPAESTIREDELAE